MAVGGPMGLPELNVILTEYLERNDEEGRGYYQAIQAG